MAKKGQALSRPLAPPAISNLPGVQRSNRTTGVLGRDLPTIGTWSSGHETSAPAIGVSEAEAPATTWAGVFDRYVRGKLRFGFRTVVRIVPIAWFAVVAWLFLQDNDAGRLEGWPGLQQLGIKAAVLAILAVVAVVGSGVVGRLTHAGSDDS